MTVVLNPISDSLLTMLKNELAITDSADDSHLNDYITDAKAVLHSRFGLTTVPAAASTKCFGAYGSLVLFDEPCASITAVACNDDSTLTYTAVTDGILLGADYMGDVLVTATWGAADYDREEKRAIILTAATYYKRSSYGTDDAPYRGGGDPIPAEAKAIMQARKTVRL